MAQTAKKTTDEVTTKTAPSSKVKETPKATGSNVTALTDKSRASHQGKTTNSLKTSPSSTNTKADVPSTMKETTPKPAIIKGAQARIFKSPPLKTNMRKITKMGVHPGSSLRFKRWDATLTLFNQRKAQGVALTLRDLAEIEGLAPADAVFWHDNKLLTLTDPTEAEMKAATDAWAKQNKNNS